MRITAGIDVGSTYTKAIVLDSENRILGRRLEPTGFKLDEVAENVLAQALAEAGVDRSEVEYIVSTGFGRHQMASADTQVTDLTASARGAMFLFPGTRTVLDVGGQTMKASRLDATAAVKSFRLNDKCAAGTGAFLEKTARYMGYSTIEIGPLVNTSKNAVPISGVCAVFAESEVINQLSEGTPPADIMHGAIVSLVGRSVQLMKRAQMEPEFTLLGGIMRFEKMVTVVREQLGEQVNVPEGDLVQFTSALGAALLGQLRLQRLAEAAAAAAAGPDAAAASATPLLRIPSRWEPAEPDLTDSPPGGPPDGLPDEEAALLLLLRQDEHRVLSTAALTADPARARRRLGAALPRRRAARRRGGGALRGAGLRGRSRGARRLPTCRPTAPTASSRPCSRSRRSTPASPRRTTDEGRRLPRRAPSARGDRDSDSRARPRPGAGEGRGLRPLPHRPALHRPRHADLQDAAAGPRPRDLRDDRRARRRRHGLEGRRQRSCCRRC